MIGLGDDGYVYGAICTAAAIIGFALWYRKNNNPK
jgi:hypothetical protein